ncbi:MAG: hypothetical protein IPI49_09085 [Myxococcales bacterium]|nr:hypothetical protein [Myxococcales bacterium]
MTDDELLPAPTMIARSLDRARKGQLLYVGNDGEVRSPEALRTRNVVAYGLVGGVTASGVVLAAMTFPPIIPLYLALGGRFAASAHAIRRLNESSAALGRGEPEAARLSAEPVARAWWLPRHVRALAEIRVAAALALEGNAEAALTRLRQGRAKLAAKSVQQRSSRFTEVHLLTQLGRLDEARATLHELGDVPTGEVLRVAHWLAELHLACAEGKHTLTEPELHERARKGLAMTAGRDLLQLCAWGYAQLGDREQVEFLLGEALDREGSSQLEITMPSLARWLASADFTPRRSSDDDAFKDL